jgi:hypothetical protein
MYFVLNWSLSGSGRDESSVMVTWDIQHLCVLSGPDASNLWCGLVAKHAVNIFLSVRKMKFQKCAYHFQYTNLFCPNIVIREMLKEFS